MGLYKSLNSLSMFSQDYNLNTYIVSNLDLVKNIYDFFIKNNLIELYENEGNALSLVSHNNYLIAESLTELYGITPKAKDLLETRLR